MIDWNHLGRSPEYVSREKGHANCLLQGVTSKQLITMALKWRNSTLYLVIFTNKPLTLA